MEPQVIEWCEWGHVCNNAEEFLESQGLGRFADDIAEQFLPERQCGRLAEFRVFSSKHATIQGGSPSSETICFDRFPV